MGRVPGVDAVDDDRRRFLRAAVAAGGLGALSACLGLEGDGAETVPQVQGFTFGDPEADVEVSGFPRGPDDPSTLPEHQHAWGPYLVRNVFGTTRLPQYQSVLFFDLVDDGPPDADDREQVRRTLESVDRAFQRGNGGDDAALLTDGLLYLVGYSPSYFDRYDEPLHESVDLMRPETVIEEVDLEDDDPTVDEYDVCVHLASGYASILLATEAALVGRVDELNGVEVAGSFQGVLQRRERRAGFVGQGNPARNYDNDDIPDSTPLSMGFRSGLADNLPSFRDMTIESGPFAGGTTQQVSRVENDLESWYDRPKEERVDLMFTPEMDVEDVGDVGERLGSESGLTEEMVENVHRDAREQHRVGHGQKTAMARNDDFEQIVLRRDFDLAETPGILFDGWQRGISDFVEMRQAMNGDDVEGIDDVPIEENGILDFIEVTNRATFLAPPRPHRALPEPNPEA